MNESDKGAVSDDKKQIKTVRKIYPQIYSFTLPNRPENDGWQKVGYTERYNADDRIRQEVQTAALKEHYEKLWSASSVYPNGRSFFNDKKLHAFYRQNEIPQSKRQDDGGLGQEWFYFGNNPEKSKQLFDTFKNNGYIVPNAVSAEKYVLRDEQEDAVSRTLTYARANQTTDFEHPNDDADYLWNAKPRFGKTLAAYDFAKRFGAKQILIITNRPSIANSWYDDYKKFIDGYYFISTADSLKNRPTLSREEFINRDNPTSEDKQITFLSLQDLKGGRRFGGKFNKLDWVADLEWDLLIFDESHEASDTDKTLDALDKIKRRFSLYLSGTPFKALANNRFHKEQIFNWTYLDEQEKKKAELAAGNENGPHTNLPDMRLFTYKMSDMIADRLEGGIDIGDENYDFAFDLNEMFATDKNGNFIHEKEILTFLDKLTSNKKYPFSTPELRDELKHTFWLVGNRVASAKAMARLLHKHPVFGQYHIIIAAGDGKVNSGLDSSDDSEEEINNIAENENAFNRVKAAIINYDKTITLSVGQLTTGVTVKEWSAVLMLSDIKSESLYMQAIFRSQNPYDFSVTRSDGSTDFYRKKSAYVFDFSPNRVLQVYDKFANGLQAEAATGEVTGDERQRCIAELLNYFPVLAEDRYGEMIELNAEEVLTYPKAIVAREVVNRGFVTNLLFANIDHVFNIPTELANILNKAKTTNESGRESSNRDVEHDSSRAEKRERRISANKNNMLGQKVYGDAMLEIIEDAIVESVNNQSSFTDSLASKFGQQIEEPLAIFQETYAPSRKELEETRNKEIEKAIGVAQEYISKDIYDAGVKAELASKLAEIIETDLPKDTVEYKEEQNYEKEEQTELDQIRAKLRTFTRAIPSFIMAARNVDEITIDNIENTVSDAEFEEIFTEKDSPAPFTKEDFRKLRDPGIYHEPDGREVHFEGFFDRYVFNAAIREFEEKRQELADYLQPDTKEDIFSYVRPLKTNQIFTPRKVVNMMLDLLEENNPGIFENPNLTFADLYVKSGLYLTEIAKRLNRGLENIIPNREERIKHIFEHQLYGFAPTGIIYNIAHKYIYGNFNNVDDRNFIQQDLAETFKNNQELNMKFDVIVGNPPYQGENHQQLYPDFYLAAKKNSDRFCLIFPTGWQEPKNANQLSKLNKKEVKEDHQIIFIDNRRGLFDGVMGAEWTNIILWRKGYDNGLDGLQKVLNAGKNPENRKLLIDKDDVEKPQEIVALEKIVLTSSDFRSANLITSVRKPYGLSTDVIGDPSKYGLPPMNNERENDSDFVVYGLENRRQTKKYIPNNYPLPRISDNLKKYKVFIGKAWGNFSNNYLGGAYSDIIIAAPNEICTENFLESGSFDDYKNARKHSKYLMTRFCRALLFARKYSQDNSKDRWVSVPIQDYSESWWDESIDVIDEKLFEKYKVPDNIKQFVFDNIQRRTEANIVNFNNE